MRPPTRSRNRTSVGLRLGVASIIVGLTTASLTVLPAQLASAATLTVTTCANSGTGSLPVVVAGASSGDTITFASGLSCPPASPITVGTLGLSIAKNLTITGPGPRTMAVTGGDYGVLDITSGVVAISGLTIEGGSNGGNGGDIINGGTLTLTDSTISGSSVGGDGSGIYNTGTLTLTGSIVSGNTTTAGGGSGIDNAHTLTLVDSTVSDNSAEDNGGGILNEGTLSVVDSTVSGNSAGDFGGGGARGGGIDNTGTLTLTDSTVSDNSATSFGSAAGGIANSATAKVGATIVADNTSGTDPNCDGSVTSVGYNLTNDTSGAACGFTQPTDVVGANPLLGPLANNGGLTQTQLPAATSPAVGLIPNPKTLNSVSVCPRTDQRGVASVGKCTIGAVEGGFLITTTSLPNVTPGTAYGPVTLMTQEAGTSTSPYVTTLKWKKVSLPKGLKLSKTGVLSGRPSKKLVGGASSVKAQVTETVITRNGKKKVKTKTTVQATIPLTIT